MHLRQAEAYVHLQRTTVLYQFADNRFIFQVSKTAAYKFSFGFYAGCFIEVVICAEIVFIQQQVHLATTAAAERMTILCNGFYTGFAAMITGKFYMCC